jgi:hypothetical protein
MSPRIVDLIGRFSNRLNALGETKGGSSSPLLDVKNNVGEAE